MAKKGNNNSGLISTLAVAAILIVLALPFFLSSGPRSSRGRQVFALQQQKICRYRDANNKIIEITADGPEIQYNQ